MSESRESEKTGHSKENKDNPIRETDPDNTGRKNLAVGHEERRKNGDDKTANG